MNSFVQVKSFLRLINDAALIRSVSLTLNYLALICICFFSLSKIKFHPYSLKFCTISAGWRITRSGRRARPREQSDSCQPTNSCLASSLQICRKRLLRWSPGRSQEREAQHSHTMTNTSSKKYAHPRRKTQQHICPLMLCVLRKHLGENVSELKWR